MLFAADRAARASARRLRADAESMTATTSPLVTVLPGVTARLARVPSAGAVRVATALAVTDAGTSTTSVTVARLTASVAMPSVDGSHAAAVRERAATARATRTRGVRRIQRSLLRPA